MHKNLFPCTTNRIASHTKCNINSNIKDETIKCLNLYKNSSKELISDKIKKLNNEWDVDRIIEAKAGCIVLMCSILGLSKSGKPCFVLTGLAGFFLLQHAIQGCCPTNMILREMGIRSAEEINNEKTVLKIMRGDFSDANTANADIAQLLELAEK